MVKKAPFLRILVCNGAIINKNTEQPKDLKPNQGCITQGTPQPNTLSSRC